MPLKVRLY